MATTILNSTQMQSTRAADGVAQVDLKKSLEDRAAERSSTMNSPATRVSLSDAARSKVEPAASAPTAAQGQDASSIAETMRRLRGQATAAQVSNADPAQDGTSKPQQQLARPELPG